MSKYWVISSGMPYGLKITLHDLRDILVKLINTPERINILLYDNERLMSCEVIAYDTRSSTISLKSVGSDYTISIGKIKHIEFVDRYVYRGIASKLFSTL
jgi:hypothetical protein